MRLPRTADTRSSRTPLAITALMLCALCAALPAAAQTTGVIAFRDDCTGILYAMRGNGSGRTALRFPPLPGPVDEYEYRDPWVLDITTTGPLTVVYYVGIVRQGFSTLDDSSGLYAVEVSDPGSSLFSGPPLRLVLPEAVSFGNVSRWGAFSLSPERLALVAPLGEPGHVFMTAAVDRT